MFGICNLSIVPCRKEPSDKSEMVTQLLFGEHFQLLDSKGNWQLIRIAHDGYECWIDKKQFLPLSAKTHSGIKESGTAVTTDLLQLAASPPCSAKALPPSAAGSAEAMREGEKEREQHIAIVLGSSLPKYRDKEFFLGKEKYVFEGSTAFPFKNKDKAPSWGGGLGEVALWYLNAPYLWGGRSPFGIDCSGLTQMVFKLNGIKLKRDAWQQAEQGKALSFLEEAQTGDLAFFDNEDGKIVHVGIIASPLDPLSKGRGEKGTGVERGEASIIHACGKVRIDKIDHQGIYNEEIKKYTHRLRVVKRMH